MAAISFWLLTATVCLAPLPFGGNQPWAWSLLALIVGIQAALWGMVAMIDRRLVTMRRWRTLPYGAAFLLLLLWYLLQAVPMTPVGWHHPAWQQTADALGEQIPGRLSLTPDRTLATLMRLISYGLVFWLALHLLRSRRRARQFLWALALAGGAYAVYGLVVKLSGGNQVLWLEKYSYRESLTGTFINRNHAAAYAAVGLMVTLGLLLDRLNSIELPSYLGWRGRIVVGLDSLGFAVWLLSAMSLLQLVALLLTGSRGGMAATLLAVPALFLLLARRRRGRKRLLLAAGALAAVFLVAIAQSGGLLEHRLGIGGGATGADENDRLNLYGLALELIAERPLAGSGLGSFAGVFLEARDEAFGLMELNQVRVHNTYLEVLLEAGVPAGLLQVGLLVVMAGVLWRGMRDPGVHPFYPALVLGVALLLGLHSLVDFPLQMPGIAITFAALLGLGVAQAYPHQPR